MEKYKKYLPSKKFVIILSSVVLALVIIFATKILINIKDTNKKVLAETQQREIVLREKFLALDSDNDTLKDWEEALWQTDPKIADTDKDGTDDGVEIKAYRDPLKPGPKDAFDATEVAATKKMMEEYESLNETEKFSRTIFANFLATQPVDGEMTDAQVEAFVADAVKNIPEKKDSVVHTIKELTIMISPKETDLENYRKTISDILTADFLPFIAEDVKNLQLAITTSDPSKYKVVDKSIESYKTAVSSILKTKVPSLYTTDTLAIINSLEQIISSISDIKVFSVNPIISVPAINQIPIAMSSLETALIHIGLLLN